MDNCFKPYFREENDMPRAAYSIQMLTKNLCAKTGHNAVKTETQTNDQYLLQESTIQQHSPPSSTKPKNFRWEHLPYSD